MPSAWLLPSQGGSVDGQTCLTWRDMGLGRGAPVVLIIQWAYTSLINVIPMILKLSWLGYS